ncbi:MAG: DUF3137 domain-containing protein [Peptococcaceae bacterium]|nr:DUF3137 domain-containing protein [Peptococcaceae bacterium]
MKNEKQICPFCGETLKGDRVRCEVCGMASDANAADPRLSDEELSKRLTIWHKEQRKFTAFGITLICLFILFPFMSYFIGAVAIVGCLAALGGSVFFFGKAGKLKRKTKNLIGANLVRDILAEVFELKEYVPDKYIDRECIAATQVIPHWDECSGSNYVCGKYRGVECMFSDIHLKRVTEDENKARRTTLFKGQWIACEFGKKIETPLLVRERPKGKSMHKLEKTKRDLVTQNAAFNEKFQILADDPQSALNLLTPRFMEHIVSAAATADARTYLYIGDMWVHIAVDNRRVSFEAGKGADVSDIRQLRTRMKSELRYITGIIDELLKNEYLFDCGD